MPSAACCPCGQLAGCVCGGLNCATICERKTGSAELCGFPEFLPSDPPKFYKRRTTSGQMTILLYGDPDCGGTVVVPSSVECQAKGGIATMCGIEEWTNQSTPPKFYRRNQASGSLTKMEGPTCTDGAQVLTWSGAVQFSKTTGVVVSDDRCFQTNGGPCQGAVGFNNYAPSGSGWAGPANDPNAGCGSPVTTEARTAEQTTSTTVGRNICADCGAGGSHKTTGSNQGLLSDEDSEQDAVARALSAANWTPGGCDVMTSQQSKRTDDHFNYQFAQTRLVVSGGLTIGETYEGRISVLKRLNGTSAPYVNSGNDIIIVFTATAAAFTSDWRDLPNDQSFQYMAGGSVVRFGMESAIVDNWNLEENFNPNLPASCFPSVVTDTSSRTVDGAPVAWPFDGFTPGDAYTGLAVGTVAPTNRQTLGTNVCVDTVGDWSKANGTVTESLNDEDTEQDAIDRATAAAAWVPCVGGCALPGCTSFETLRGTGATFGFGIVRTKAQWVAVLGANYKVTIRFASRVLGTGGPFLFFALTETVVTADTVNESTDWFDAPREAGLEIIVANCSVELLP
jgi:hypothetical protein